MNFPLTVQSPAKINLHLGVGELGPDGFHELTTVYQAINIHDIITIDTATNFTVTGGGPDDATNLAWRAAVELAQVVGHKLEPLSISIEKNIPVAAGLAGGSADAAAVLRALGKIWNAEHDQLELVAKKIGSDVPFLLHGGICLGTGHGEVITSVLNRGHYHWVVVADNEELSTPRVYQELDRIRERRLLPESVQADSPEQLLLALSQGQPQLIAPYLINDLQPAAISLLPKLRKTLNAGIQSGALAGLVSGSGPTCIFLAEGLAHATEIAAELAGRITAKSIKIATGPVSGAHLIAEK